MKSGKRGCAIAMCKNVFQVQTKEMAIHKTCAFRLPFNDVLKRGTYISQNKQLRDQSYHN